MTKLARIDRRCQILDECRRTTLKMPCERLGDAGFSVRRDATLQLMHALGHDVVADDLVAEFGKSDDASHPDISGSDDGDFRWFRCCVHDNSLSKLHEMRRSLVPF